MYIAMALNKNSYVNKNDFTNEGRGYNDLSIVQKSKCGNPCMNTPCWGLFGIPSFATCFRYYEKTIGVPIHLYDFKGQFNRVLLCRTRTELFVYNEPRAVLTYYAASLVRLCLRRSSEDMLALI